MTGVQTCALPIFLGPENIFPDIVWDPDGSCQRLELGVSVSGIPGGSPLDRILTFVANRKCSSNLNVS